jgi:hypothetical protein
MLLVRALLSLLLSMSVMAQDRRASDPVPAPVLEVATRTLGSGATIIRYGHLSGPEQTEAVAVVPGSTSDKAVVSKLVVLRQLGSNWNADLTVDKVIRNTQGFVGAIAIDQVHRSDHYLVHVSNRIFEDGKNRFVIELTPSTADGKSSGPSVYISWNSIVGRYQQISLQGYGFEPELHEPLPANTP